MAYTYSKIATYTVGSGGDSAVSFLNIPQTYTDLQLILSLRTSRTSDIADSIKVTFNSDTVSTYSTVELRASVTGSSVTSVTRDHAIVGYASDNANTVNTFSNHGVYLPNYTSSKFKQIIVDNTQEDNVIGVYMALNASLFQSSNPITSMTFVSNNSANFVQHSTFHLYGIKAEI